MNRRFILAVAAVFVLAVAAPAFAQGGGNPPPPAWGGHGPGPGGFEFGGFARGFGGKTVTGAPFTATVTSTHNQKLADGNSVAKTTTGTVARDSAGRTRHEMTLPAIGPLSSSGQAPHLAFINDPTSHTNVTLNLDRKTAEEFSPRGGGANGRGGPNGPRAQGMRGGQGGGPDGNSRANVTRQSLGTKTVNGVNAEGTMITHTIPAGAMGNTEAITITTERWFSPDLQTVVSETRTDPRFGTSTMQLTNINRSEPDASLFTVPQDFAVTQGHPHGMRKGPGGPGSN